MDTIFSPISDNLGIVLNGDISGNNTLAAITLLNNRMSLASIDLQSYETEKLVDLENVFNNSRVTGLCWSHNSEGVYFTIPVQGLFYVNANNLQLTRLKLGCQGSDYRNVAASPDGEFLIVEKVTRTLQTDSDGNTNRNVIVSHSLVKIYLDTLEEVPLTLKIN